MAHPKYKFLIFALMALATANSYAQYSVNMSNGQTLSIDGCLHPTGTIYDDGGPNGSYSNNFDGYVVITVPSGITINITGSYDLEGCCDYITIWDGDANGTQLWNSQSPEVLNGSATSGTMTIRFHSDYSSTPSGFALSYSCSGVGQNCINAPTGVTVSNITTSSAQVDWNATNTSGPFMVNLNGNISTVNTNTLSLTGLNANTHYDLAISSVSDNWAPCCTARESFRTACGTMNPPMQESFDDYGIGYNIIPTCWTKLLNYDDTLNEPQIVGNPYSSSPGALRMYCGSNNDGNHYSMVIAPRMNVDDIATMSVRFSLRAAYSGTYIIVGVCDSTLRSNNNFTPVDTLTVNNINTWEEKLVPLASYTGSGKYIAFRMQRSLQSGDGRFIFIDDVALIPCGTWNERLYNRTSNSMWLSFDTIGSPVVNIEYGVAGFTSGTGTAITGVTSPLRLTGLTPSTQYEVHIHSLCSGVPVEPRSVQWSTLEGPDNNITQCQDFETGSTLPPSWLRTGVYDGTPTTSTSYHHSGGRSLRVRPYYTNTMPIVALPLIDTVSVQHLNVSFYLYSDGYTSGKIEVGIMEYPENATSFIPVDTVYCTASRSWQYKQVSLDRYSGTGSYIALRASDPNTPYNSMYIDDLNVGSCLAGGVHYTNVGSHSVEIRWDTVGTSFHGDSIIVEYGGTGFEEGTGTRLSVPVRGVNRQLAGGQQRLVVSGLAADSSYQFIVYGACDTIVQHCDAVRLSAHTLEQDILLPFCVDFEGMADGSFPSGWYRPSMYDNFPRIYDNGVLQHSGSRALYLRSYRDLENHSTIVLPLLETDSMNGLVVDFFAYGNAGDGHTLQIGIMEDPNDENTFTAIATAAVGYHRWERHVVAINGYIGTGRHIAIRNRNNYYYSSEGVWIDDLVVSSADASGRTVNSVTSHGATFTWQPQGRSYNGAIVEWGPTGFTRGTGTIVTVDANTFSLTVDTLQTNTTYDCYITALSSETAATCNYGCNTFTTFEHPMVSSYCYSFEDTDPYGFPSGWTRPIVYDSRPRVENTAHTGSSSLYMRSYNCSGNNYTSMAAMSYLEETSLDGLTLTFYTRGYNYYSSSRLYIGMLTDPSSPATFDTIAEINYDWSSNWQRHTVDLSSYTGNGRHIAFWLVTLNGCNEGNIYLDDITLSRCDITDVHIYSITAHDAWLTWGTNGSVDSVDVEYISSTSSSPTIVTNATSPLHLAGLNADETYTCQVRAWCTRSASSCSNDIYTFTTRTDSIAPGYCCDFGSATPWQPPQYWTILQSYDNHPQVIETDGDRNLEFYTCSYEGTGNLIVMPAAENPVAGGVVSFSLRCTNSSVRNRVRFTIGVITTPYDSSTFVPIRTIYPTYQWHRYSVDLSAYTGTARHIAFRYTSTDGCFYTLLDDLGFSLCRPGDLRATNISDQSCRLTWRNYGTTSNSTRYTVEYGPTGFTRGSGTLIHTTDTTVAVTGLTNSTSYQFFVWSSCQDSAECQQEEVTVHTLDEPLYTPFCNNFDSETADRVPADWVRPYGDEYPRISTDRSHSSNKSIQFYSYCCNNWEDQTSMAAMPMVSTDNMSSLQVDFYYYNENPDAALVIGVMTNPRDTNTFTPLHTVRTSGHWARIKKSLSSYSGSGRYIAFRYRASYCSSGWAYIDDLTLRNCAITDCRLSGLGQDGVDVVWHATASTPGVWMTYGHSASSQSAPTYHTSSPIHIAGLTEATPFEIHLWPQCDSTPDNCNYETLREETLHTWVNIPYCTNFDGIGSNSFPNNWRRLSTVGSDYPRTSSYIRHSEGNSMQFYAVDSLYSLAAMPTVNPSNGCMAVSGLYANFWTRFEGYSSSARLVVGVMTDILDTNSFVGVDTLVGNYSDWEHHTLSLAAYTGSGHIIAFKLLTADGNWCECYLDDLCIEKCVSSDLTITDITQNSITVSWTGHGTQGIIVEYGPRGFAHGHGTFDTLLTSPTTIDGLSELTEYEFNFKTLCDCQIIGATYLPGGGSPGTTSGGSWGGGGGTGGGGGGGWGGGTGIIITTQAHYLEIPYCESYETYDTLNFPPSYRRIIGSSNLYPVLTTTNHHSGEGCMALYTTTDTACFFSLPPLEEGTTTEMVMTFYAYAVNGYATSTDALQVGIMSNPDDASTYTPIAAFRLDNTARWQQFSVDFAPYIGSGQYITFRFKPIYASYIYYIDDIYVGRCGITNVQFTTSPTSVQVGWTALHNPTAVNIEYGRQGYDRTDSTYSPTVVTASYSPCTIAGIDPDSNYDFYIMAQCSDTDMALCAPVAYTLNPMLYPPYCQDFEDLPSGVLPDHWKVVRGRDPYPLTETQYGQQIVAFYPCSYNDNTVLLRPLPSGDSLGGKWVYADFSTSNNNYIYLDFGTLADTSDANTFVQMASLSNGQTDQLQEFNVQLSCGSPDLNRLAIRARSTSGCRWIRLARLALTDYPYPTGLNSTVYGSSTRRIAWSGQYNNPYYTIEYGYGDNWRIVASDSCQALLSNLEPAQTYQVFFISPDGERLCLPYTFTTPDAVPLPHCDNFDSYDDYSVPPGWYSFSAYGDNYPRTYSSNYRSCCRTMDFYTNNNHLQYTALPDFDIDSVKHLDLQFSLRIEDVSRMRLVVGVMDDRTNFNTFVPVDTLTCPSNSVHFPQHVSLASYNGTGRFVAFLITTTGGRNAIYLDDLVVSPCPLPDLTVSGARQVKAALPEGTPADYWMEYGPDGCTQGDSSNTLVHVTENPYYITGLQPNTTYNFFARCFEQVPTCAPPTTLTTALEMPLPYCENFDNIGNTGHVPMWTYYNSTQSNPFIHNSQPYIYSNYSTSPSKSLEFYSHPNYRCYAILPDIDVDSIQMVTMSFNLLNYQYAYSGIIVGVMSDATDVSSFTPVDTFFTSSNYSWEAKTINFAHYIGSGRFIAFLQYNRDNSWRYLCIDDVRLSSYPTPSFALTNATTVQATIPTSIIEEINSTNYWIEYGLEGCSQGDSSNIWIHVTTDTFNITNLQELTTYVFYHHADSGDITCYPFQRITTSTILSIPYCENFDIYSTPIPSGWFCFSSNNNNRPILTHSYTYNSSHSSLLFNANTYSDCYAVMPQLQVDSLDKLWLNVALQAHNPYNAFISMIIGIMTNPFDITTFIPVDTIHNNSEWWHVQHISLSNYSGNGGFIAFKELNTYGSSNLDAYIDDIIIDVCDIPIDIHASLSRHNEVRIDASEPSRTGFWVEYGSAGFEQGTGTFVHIDSLPTHLTLANSTTYDFYFRCDTVSPTCIPLQQVTTQAGPIPVPLCMDFDTCQNNRMPYGWHNLRVPQEYGNDVYVYSDQSHSGSRSLRFCSAYTERTPLAVLPDLQVDSLSQLAVSFWMKNNNYGTFILDLGVMSDPYDASSFITLKRFSNTLNNTWQRMQAILTSAPAEARFLAFRLTKTSGSWDWLYLDDLYITTCGAADLQVAGMTANQITLDWRQAGRPDITVEYGPVGFADGTGTTLHPTAPPLTVGGLDNLTNYEFRYCASCDDNMGGFCGWSYCDTIMIFTPAGGTGCIDPTNLTAEYTTCTYGSYSNPRSRMGVVNYGNQSALSRHTVHYDTTERDPRTGGLLRTVPEGAVASVRLGNWTSNSSNPEAESVTYSLFVDPSSFDLLILKYAAVLQDPEHSAAQQPRFSIEILNEYNELIDSRCGAADFIANANLGWNEAANDVLWKDWTTVGLDMSAYANQTIRIRLTTYDCGEGSHYGYAYFTLDCLLKNIRAEYCGEVESNIFTMPDGFNYNWYTDTVERSTLYTTQSINIPTSNTTYYCDVSFVDNAECFFTMSAYAGTRYPLALFDSVITLNNCQFYVQFNNLSTISTDGVTPIGTGEGCESAFWDFGNGMTSTDYNGSTVYTTPGTYDVMLISYLGGGSCADTIIKTLTLEYPSASPSLAGPTNRCAGNLPDTVVALNGVSYQWITNDTTSTWTDSVVVLTPTADTVLRCIVTNADGCTDTLQHAILVHPVFDLSDTLTLCTSQLPFAWGDTTLAAGTQDGTYAVARRTVFGCDSSATLSLTVNDVSSGDTTAVACDQFAWHDSVYTTSTIASYITSNVHGCDSTVTLHLTVRASSHGTGYDTVASSALPYSYHDHTLTGDTTVQVILTNAEECDSTIDFHLTVIWQTYSTLYDTVCESELPYTWNHRTFAEAGTQYDTLPNAAGADSLLTMVLHVLPTWHQDFFDTICSNQTASFGDSTYSTAGDYTHALLTNAGCDSLRTLHLAVISTSAGDTSASACNQFTWHDSLYTASTTATHITTGAQGCDSTVTLHLTVNLASASTYYDTCTENQLPRTFHSITAHGDTAGAQTVIVNAAGCDSVITYHLHVLWNNRTTVHDTVCDSELPYTWNHRTFAEAGTQYDTLPNAAGADSLLTMVLHVLPTWHLDFYDTICSNQTVSFGDSTYSTAGDYTQALLTTAGCDSLRTLHLAVLSTSAGDTSASACDQFTWHDSLYTASTTATYITTGAQGCDSTVTLHLTVQHSITDTVNAVILDWNLPFIFAGDTFFTPIIGMQYHFTSSAGCDSLVILNLSIVNTLLPDNVDSADCIMSPERSEWGIQVGWSSAPIVANRNIPLVGDLDGDSIPEIVCFAQNGESYYFGPISRYNTLLVFDGSTKVLKETITLPSPVSGYEAAAYGLVKTAAGVGLIIVASYDFKLRAYDITSSNPSLPYWISDVDYGSNTGDWSVNLGFADFNQDGHPELYVRNKIYNAETGTLLASVAGSTNTGSSYSHWTHITHWKLSSPFAADVCGDAKPELILGNEIYNVSITNTSGPSGNTISLARQVTPPSNVPADGHPQVADFNLDGYPDILISIRSTDNQNGTVYGYVWDVHNNSTSSPFSINTSWSGKSVPMIADIDNDGSLEVLIQCGVANSDNKFRAYKYIDSLQSFTLMWDLSTDEDSYSNSITSFDFNQDGLLELIISDQSRVRIVNGSGKSHLTYNDTVPVYVMNVFPFTEVTIMQYPLIADVDCDGNAEIVSVGNHQLNIFESTGFPWAPARKVWNQYLYNVTCVNEDLTIPQYLFNNATVFIDPDNVARRPYNNFLQQATTINQYGQPFNAVPDAESVSATASHNDDTLTLTVSYCNRGDDRLMAPYGITVYLNEYHGTLLWTDTVTTSLDIDSCTAYSILIPINALCGLQSSDSLLIALNDFGDGIAQHGASQLECDTTNNTISIGTTIYRSNSDTSAVTCDSLIWYGIELTTSCDTTHVLSNIYGCDSVVTMHLTVYHSTADDTSASACDQFSWHDSLYTASTTASFITTGAQGCDSTVTLHLTMNRSSASTYHDTCTENQLPHSFHSITAHGDTAGAQTIIVNAAGCDSVITYHLHVLWNNRTTVHDTVCDSELPYTWNHRTFAEAGTQYDTLTNAAGADSLLTMVLHVLPTWHLDFYDTICSNQTTSFGDSTYSTAGDYTHALLTNAGCDSLRTLHLAVLSTSAGDTSATACDQFTWHDSLYTASTTASYTTTNAHGCDSTVTLHLAVYPSVSINDADTICQNQLANGYTWRDTVLYTAPDSGIYTRTRTTVHGCDSTLTLALSVMPNTASTVFDTIVENQAATWQFNGIAVPTDTTGMLITITNYWGCDSVINYNLHVWYNSHGTIDSSICDNLTSTFSWYGHPYADTLRHTLTDSHGADSVVTLLMHTLPSAQTTLYDTICQGTVYSFADTLVDQAGDYTASLLTAYGCDSVVTLHLVVLPSFQVDVYDTIRPGDVIYYDSNVYTQAGDYPLRHIAANGCDSIVVLHLSEIRYTEIRHSDTICQGDTLYFHTRPLTASGIYTDTTFSPDRLSDTVWVEDLSVVPYHTVSIESDYTCLDPPHYTLVARTDAPYIRWTSRPDDGILPSEKDTIAVNPDDPTTYYLTADYRPEPLCPSTDSITLVHIEPVLARISSHPDHLTDDLRLLKAQNVSIGTLDEHRWTVWYNENPFTWDTANTILLDVPYTVDSVVIQLTVSNGLCADTASVTVLNLSDAIYLPNVFTPDKPTNNTFYAVGKGILEFEIWIYDRRGDLVYHSTDINEHWNGTHNGLICHQGTYVYRCRYTTTLVPNGWQTLTGTVTILK